MTQRERFEAWASAPGREYPLARTEHGGYRSHQVESMWIGWQAACPDGWQAVPRQPDGAMQVAGLKARVDEDGTAAVYRAMLADAPKPEDV